MQGSNPFADSQTGAHIGATSTASSGRIVVIPPRTPSPLCSSGASIEIGDPVYGGSISFQSTCKASRVISLVVNDPWIARLAEINQSGTLGVMYPTANNSRLAHVLGVSALGIETLRNLWEKSSASWRATISDWSEPFALALITHDLCHMAPGSHGAYKVLFPGQPDVHEKLACKVLRSGSSIKDRLAGIYGAPHSSRILERACSLISEDTRKAPAFLIQLLSGGCWNVDRGDWIRRDLFTMRGGDTHNVNHEIQKALSILPDGNLCVEASALRSIETLALTRERIYREALEHPRALALYQLNSGMVQCARDIGLANVEVTPLMKRVLSAPSADELSIDDIFAMREHQWLVQRDIWAESSHTELRKLALALRDRTELATYPIRENQRAEDARSLARELSQRRGINPNYSVSLVQQRDPLKNEFENSLRVRLDGGAVVPFESASRIMRGLAEYSRSTHSRWIVMPSEIQQEFSQLFRLRQGLVH